MIRDYLVVSVPPAVHQLALWPPAIAFPLPLPHPPAVHVKSPGMSGGEETGAGWWAINMGRVWRCVIFSMVGVLGVRDLLWEFQPGWENSDRLF